MDLYRYEVKSDKKECSHISGLGILTSLDYIFDNDDYKIIDLTYYFLDKLPDPLCNMNNTRSYFTQKGNRKFNKAIKNLKKAIEKEGFKVITIHEKSENLHIIYKDAYQVVASTL